VAEQFKSYMEKYPKLYQHLAKKIKEQLPNELNSPIILDLGMGVGLLSVQIKNIIPNAQIIGLDASAEMIELAKKQKIDGLKILHAPAEKIPLDDNICDIVVSRFSLPYWNDPNQVFSEINRILKPGGKLVLEALNKDFPKWRLSLIKFHMWFNRAAKVVIKYHIDAYDICYSKEEIEQFHIKSKLKITDFEGKNRNWSFLFIAKKNL